MDAINLISLQYLNLIMFQATLPKQLDYKFIPPKGFPSIYKQWQLDPMTNNKQWSNNDIVRFNFMNIGGGVFDPYRSYIQITVSSSTTNNPVGILQIDNSAQSFINQTVLYSKNRQIQRITQYAVLAAYLNDVGLSQIICDGRDSQGFGYGSFDTMPFPKAQSNNIFTPRTATQTTTVTTTSGNVFPTIGNMIPYNPLDIYANSILNASKNCKGHISNSNPIMSGSDLNAGSLQPYQGMTGMEASLNVTGYANNIRAQYQSNFVQNKFPEATYSIPNYELFLNSSVSNLKYPFLYNQTIPYQVYSRAMITDMLPFDTTQNTINNTVTCSNYGFSSLFCPYFTRGCFQPFISPTVPQNMIINGNFQQTKSPIYKKKFKIPLISAVIGVLMDPNNFSFIPLASINDLLLQITLEPFAMFTSGYSDVCQMDSVGINVQQKRNYQIQKIKYKIQTYHFLAQQIKYHIETALYKQITLVSNLWQLGNQFQIPGGTPVNNNYIVGLNSKYLNQIVCLFVANDYQTYSFARKHYRLSNNVRRFWSKLAVDYWPPQPYKGNGGNCMSNNDDDDNSNFVQNIYWSNNYMFSKTPLPKINQYNFAVNDRPYNITNKNTFYDPAMLNNQNYSFSGNSVNADTAMGMSWIHENRVIGKAAYVITYTPFHKQQQILQGIDVSGLSNFEVLFEQDSSNTFSRDQTLYIFGKSSVIVKYSKNGIQTIGR